MQQEAGRGRQRHQRPKPPKLNQTSLLTSRAIHHPGTTYSVIQSQQKHQAACFDLISLRRDFKAKTLVCVIFWFPIEEKKSTRLAREYPIYCSFFEIHKFIFPKSVDSTMKIQTMSRVLLSWHFNSFSMTIWAISLHSHWWYGALSTTQVYNYLWRQNVY